jgi:LacI family transcriptional regulator
MPDEKLKKRPSLKDVGAAAGVNRQYAQRVLSGATNVPEEIKEKVLKAANDLGYTKTEHPSQHFNSKLTQERADAVIEGIIKNDSLQKISEATGLSPHTAFKLIRGVKVPVDYPETEEEWRKDVTGFLEVAIWKGTKRLAESSIMLIDDRTLPVSVAVLTDKLAVIRGQPTSIHLAMTASVNHRDLMKDLKERDVTPVNDEQLPDAV